MPVRETGLHPPNGKHPWRSNTRDDGAQVLAVDAPLGRPKRHCHCYTVARQNSIFYLCAHDESAHAAHGAAFMPSLYQRFGVSSPDGRDAARSAVGIYLLVIAHPEKASTQRTDLSCSTILSLPLFSLVPAFGLPFLSVLASALLLSLCPFAICVKSTTVFVRQKFRSTAVDFLASSDPARGSVPPTPLNRAHHCRAMPRPKPPGAPEPKRRSRNGCWCALQQHPRRSALIIDLTGLASPRK